MNKSVFLLCLILAYAFAQDSQLIGEWYVGSVSSTQYYDGSTGSWNGPAGNGWGISIVNERFTETSLLQTTIFACQTTLFLYQRGRIDTISPDTIRFSPIHGGSRKYSSTCPFKDTTVEFAQHRLYKWNITLDQFTRERTLNLYPLDEKTGSGLIQIYYKQEVQQDADKDFDVSGAMPNVNFNPDSESLENTETDGTPSESSSPVTPSTVAPSSSAPSASPSSFAPSSSVPLSSSAPLTDVPSSSSSPSSTEPASSGSPSSTVTPATTTSTSATSTLFAQTTTRVVSVTTTVQPTVGAPARSSGSSLLISTTAVVIAFVFVL